MTKPTILTIDDDAAVLSAITRDLGSRYADDYRIIAVDSGAEALELLETLKDRGDAVALFLVDQRMPGMEGTEFLVPAADLFPDAKRLLLTAYADTEAAISAINEVGLDHYLLKPWTPAEEKLYPVLDDLLSDWLANVPAPFDGIRVLGTTWSPDTHQVKDFLARNQIPYRFLDIERDAEAARLTEAASGDRASIPVVILPDGETLVQPDRRDLAQRIGLRTEASEPFYDVVIVGGGPAGLAGAVYGASEGLRVALIEKDAPGGQAGTSARIENYLGFPKGISGGDLARRAVAQATRLGAELVTAIEVTSIELEDAVKIITLSDGTSLRCHAVLIASGMTQRKLVGPGYDRFEGAGVYYGAAPSEAATYAGGHVVVIGGANSAGQAAMMLSRQADRVTIVVRADSLNLRMSQYLIDQIASTPNIETLITSRVTEVAGEDRLESVSIENLTTSDTQDLAADAVFIFVGAVPHSDFVVDLVARTERGFILTGPDIKIGGDLPDTWAVDRQPFLLETSVPGIFAAGDVRDGVVRRVASAVGQGSIAISMIHKYLETV